MHIFKKKFHTKKILVLLPIIIGVFLLSTHATYAAGTATIWDLLTGNGGISGFFAALLYPVVEILARLLALAGILVNYAIQPGDTTITGSDFVQKGWSTMRDLTNMVFILVLLGIALDYILFNSVGVKRALPRLLIIALLINFSLPIAGVVLDFANVFTVFFMSHAVGGTGTGQLNFSEALANQLHLSSLFTNSPTTAVTNVNTILNQTFTGTVFVILMLLGTLFVFIALAAMFFIRYFFISILLIVLPLALVASVIPSLGSTFGRWARKFFQWAMFAPAASFFLYLTMIFLSSEQMRTINSATSSWTVTNTGAQITTYIFAWMLMIMSLTTAQSMGAIGASTAVTMWNKGSRWAKGKAGRATTASLAAAGRRVKADEQLEGLAKGLRAIPGLGGALESGVRTLSTRTKAAMEKREELSPAEKAKYASLSDSALAAEQEIEGASKLPGAGARVAHIAALRAKKGTLVVRDPRTGRIDEIMTEKLIRESYAAAKAHKNKVALEAIVQSDPLVGRKIKQDEWERDEKAGRVFHAKFDPQTKRLISGTNKETGKKFTDALNDLFDMSSADFENLKGRWNQKNINEFIESGHLTKGRLQTASNLGDGSFIKLVGGYFDVIDKMAPGPQRDAAIANIKKVNPALSNTYKNGNLKDLGIDQPTGPGW